MKKSKILSLLVVVVFCAMVAGCGSSKDSNTDISSSEITVTAQASDNSKEVIPERTEATKEEPVLTETAMAEDRKVSNNGGHFVGFGDLIYFLEPGDDAMQYSQLFGKYLDSACGFSTVSAYDPKTGTVNQLFNDCAYGKICFTGSTLLVSVDEPATSSQGRIASYNVDTKEIGNVNGNTLMGGDSLGEYAVTYDYTSDNRILYVYKNGELFKEISDNKYSTFIGVEEGYLVVSYEMEKGYGIRCYDLNSDTRYDLGGFPKRDVDYDYADYPEVEQVLIRDGIIYASVCWYEGTGHFLAEQKFITAELTKADSLVKVQDVNNEDEVASNFVVKNGSMEISEGAPGSGFCEYGTGEYGYIDEDGKKVVLGNDFESAYDNDGNVLICEVAEYANESLYLVQNYLRRDSEYDVGWREAFVRDYACYYNVKSGQNKLNCFMNYHNPHYNVED